MLDLDPSPSPPLDEAVAVEQLGSQKLFDKTLIRLVNSAEADVAAMRMQLATGDLVTLERSAHSLLGRGKYIVAQLLCHAAHALEVGVQQGLGTIELEKRIVAISEEYGKVDKFARLRTGGSETQLTPKTKTVATGTIPLESACCLLEDVCDMILVLNGDNRIVFLNRAFRDSLRMTKDDAKALNGKNPNRLIKQGVMPNKANLWRNEVVTFGWGKAEMVSMVDSNQGELSGHQYWVCTICGMGGNLPYDLNFLSASGDSCHIDPSAKIRILVVEDDDSQAELLIDMCEECGYPADVVYTGQSALDTLRAKMGQYDLILLDMVLPDMNGDEVVKLIREGMTLPYP